MHIGLITGFSKGLENYGKLLHYLYGLGDHKVETLSLRDFIPASRSLLYYPQNKIIQVLSEMNLKGIDLFHIVTNLLGIHKLMKGSSIVYPNIKCICTLHDPTPHSSIGVKGKIKYILQQNMSNQLCITANTTKNSFIHIHSENLKPELLNSKKCIIAQHPFRIFNETKLSNDKKRIDSSLITFLFIGSNRHDKGLDILIEALKLLEADQTWNPMCRFLIKGKDVNKNYFTFTNLDVQIEDRFLSDIEFSNTILDSDFVICPYRDATQSGILANVIALGKPAIITNTGALTELVTHNDNGIVVQPENPEEIHNAIVKILSRPDLREKFLKNALIKKTKLKEYNIEIMNKLLGPIKNEQFH